MNETLALGLWGKNLTNWATHLLSLNFVLHVLQEGSQINVVW